MIESLDVKELFPTPVWIIDLEPAKAAALNARLLADIEALISPRPALPPGANWQTDPTIHRLPQFADFVRLAEQAGRGAADFLKLRARDLAITGCWANVNPPGGRNSGHTHPNNYLAGVYYVAIPDGEGRITFEDPRVQATATMPQVTEFTRFTGNSVNVEVKAGRMILFPAWLTHSVATNMSMRDRVSIAFNLMFRNFVADSSPPLWRHGTVRLKT